MRILLTGPNGQVGHELLTSLRGLGEIKAVGRDDMDLTSESSIRSVINEFRPQLLVNAAAYTAVDKAESDHVVAHAVNAEAPRVMAEEMKLLGGAIVHYSTDYVFDGTATKPYTESDNTNPQGVYGVTKRLGEEAIQKVGLPHLIFRTSWVYGVRGHNFYLTMRRLFQERPEVSVVNDQVGSPTWSGTIASITTNVLNQLMSKDSLDMNMLTEKGGLYHLTSSGDVSWHGFAKAILDQMELSQNPIIKAISTDQYPTPARRPSFSVLNCSKLERSFGVVMPNWELVLKDLAPKKAA